MAERNLVLCVGPDDSLWETRLKVLEVLGVAAVRVEGPAAACTALSKQRFAAAIIGNECSQQEQETIASMIVRTGEQISVLNLPKTVTPKLLASFVGRLSLSPKVEVTGT